MSDTKSRQRRRLAREESNLQLTDEQVNELKEAFEFFNKSGTGSIDKNDLKTALGELGLPNGASDVQEMMKECDSSGTGAITFPMFLSMMSSRLMQVDTEENLTGAFKVFDPELSGYIDGEALRKELTTKGEPLTSAEWNELVSVAGKNGQIDYMVFVNTLFSKKL